MLIILAFCFRFTCCAEYTIEQFQEIMKAGVLKYECGPDSECKQLEKMEVNPLGTYPCCKKRSDATRSKIENLNNILELHSKIGRMVNDFEALSSDVQCNKTIVIEIKIMNEDILNHYNVLVCEKYVLNRAVNNFLRQLIELKERLNLESLESGLGEFVADTKASTRFHNFTHIGVKYNEEFYTIAIIVNEISEYEPEVQPICLIL